MEKLDLTQEEARKVTKALRNKIVKLLKRIEYIEQNSQDFPRAAQMVSELVDEKETLKDAEAKLYTKYFTFYDKKEEVK